MSGPAGFIERNGEIFEVRRAGCTTKAKGLAQSGRKGGGRKYIQFLPDADIQLNDILCGTVSQNQLRVIEVERHSHGNFGVTVNAYYENLNRIITPDTTSTVNTVNIHTMTHSTLQQGSPGAYQSLTLTANHVNDADALVTQLLARVSELGLDEGREREIIADAQTIKAQLTAAKPKKAIIEACFDGLKSTIQGAVKTGASDFGGWFIEHFEKALSLWK